MMYCHYGVLYFGYGLQPMLIFFQKKLVANKKGPINIKGESYARTDYSLIIIKRDVYVHA